MLIIVDLRGEYERSNPIPMMGEKSPVIGEYTLIWNNQATMQGKIFLSEPLHQQRFITLLSLFLSEYARYHKKAHEAVKW